MDVSILVLGTADWNQPIATNQHYVARELSARWDVSYVESMGLRKPELRPSDLKRMLRRIGSGSAGTSFERPTNGINVLRPLVLPIHTGVSRIVNRPLLHRLVSNWIARPGRRLLWTYTPNTYGLERFADATVYHCVDLLGSVPGINAELIAQQERRLAGVGVTAVASSEVVDTHLAAVGFDSRRLWPNVADVEPIAQAVRRGRPRVERAVFAGNLTASKVDFELLEGLLKRGVRLDLAGPVSEGGGSSARAVEKLVAAGATHHGHLDFASLSELYARSTVGLIPYLINEYTVGVNPLKTYEYLAAGLTVVSTRVPAVSAVSGHVTVAAGPEEFLQAVVASTGTPSAESLDVRAELADRHSWTRRGAEARGLVDELMRDRVS